MADITTPPVVEPLDTAAPPAPEVAPTDPEAASSPLPEDLIAIPAFQGLLVGAPAAVSASLTDFANRPEGQLIQQHKEDLLRAGIGLYRSIQGDIGVVFNQSYISGEDLKTADKEGKLSEIAPPFDQVNSQLAASGADHPILSAQNPTGGAPKPGGPPSLLPPVASTPAPAPSLGMPPSPQKQIGQKMRNLAMGGPTSGPKPGEGRLLNAILKPVL